MPTNNDYQKDLELIRRVLRGPSANEVKLEIFQYMKLARPYFLPRKSFQTFRKKSDYLCDLIGGIPYTSKKNPWPIDPETNEFLQPILQIRLEKASKLLREPFGKGLLQVFGYTTEYYGLRFYHRVIAPENLSEPPIELTHEYTAKSIEWNEETKTRSKVSWRSAGSMFMGDFSNVDYNCEMSPPIDFNEEIPGYETTDENLGAPINLNESYEILDFIRSQPYFGTYLGGRGGNNGSRGHFLNINPSHGSLLIRIGSDVDDANIGVSAHDGDDGKIIFDVEGCYA